MKKLLETIYRKSLKSFDFQTMEDLLYMSKEAMKTDIPLGVEYLRKLSALCEKTMSNRSLSGEQVIQVYVESFSRNGYVGTVAGVNLYTKKDAVSGTIIIATKKAVTLFNKKGTEIEQITKNARSETAANTRLNTIFSRKYYLAALTDATKAVKITVAPSV